MSEMGKLFVFHKIINTPEELKEESFEEAVIEFQDKADILVDGDPGPGTLWHLQFPWVFEGREV